MEVQIEIQAVCACLITPLILGLVAILTPVAGGILLLVLMTGNKKPDVVVTE